MAESVVAVTPGGHPIVWAVSGCGATSLYVEGPAGVFEIDRNVAFAAKTPYTVLVRDACNVALLDLTSEFGFRAQGRSDLPQGWHHPWKIGAEVDQEIYTHVEDKLARPRIGAERYVDVVIPAEDVSFRWITVGGLLEFCGRILTPQGDVAAFTCMAFRSGKHVRADNEFALCNAIPAAQAPPDAKFER